MNRRIALASIPLLLAIAIVSYRQIARQRRYRAETMAGAQVRAAADDVRDRMNRKAAELDRRGIKGPERQRALNQELQAAFREWSRVDASHYRTAYNMNSD